MKRVRDAILAILLSLSAGGLTACAPKFAQGVDPVQSPDLELGEPLGERPGLRLAFTMADGERLPGRAWLSGDGPIQGVVVGVHGMGDYSNAFQGVGAWLADRGYAVYAYDQRGFGETQSWGLWPGSAPLTDDFASVVRLVRGRHPDVPVTVLGLSMGASVALAAMGGEAPPEIDRMVLAAPATWGWSTLPFLYRTALWVGVRLFPSRTFTGSGLEIWPSDNIDMLRAYSRDPLVVKGTRTDAIYGLVDLMDLALLRAPDVTVPVLVVYGAKDEIVPAKPVATLLRALESPRRYAHYPNGYHMLLRDLERETVWRDIEAYLADPSAPLPSDAEQAIPAGRYPDAVAARLRRN